MKKNLEKAGVKLLNEIETVLRDAKGLTAKQMPLLAKEILRWELVRQITDAMIHFTAAAFLLGAPGAWIQYVLSHPWQDCFVIFHVLAGLMVLGGLIGIWQLFEDLQLILQIYIAPKTYLLEYINDLVRPNEED